MERNESGATDHESQGRNDRKDQAGAGSPRLINSPEASMPVDEATPTNKEIAAK